MIKKIALAVALIVIVLYSLNDSKPNLGPYAAKLNKFRSDKNQSFRQSPESPLPVAQKVLFDSLKYYPADLTFLVHADISRKDHPDTTIIQMSDKKAEKYLHWGLAKFNIDNQPQQLVLYLKANGTDSTLFIPFTDTSNGHETYGGGRYLDLPLPKSNATDVTLDFNRAYNPFCAYNSAYSCPVPPADNRLPIAIPAGEKSFHE